MSVFRMIGARVGAVGALSVALGSLCPAVCRAETTTAEPPAQKAVASETVRIESELWFTRGSEAYAAGRYAAAVTAFSRAYELLPLPELLFNVAQALRMSGRCEEAVNQYRRFERESSQLPEDFVKLSGQAQQCAEEQRLARAQEVRPQPEPPAEKSEHALGRAGRPRSEGAQSASSAKPDGGVVEAGSPTWTTRQWIGVSCLGAGAAGGVLAGIFALRANQAADETTARSDDGARWDEHAQGNEDAGIAAARWAKVLTAGAVVAAGAGAWLLWSSQERTNSVAIGPTGVHWSGRF